MAAKVENNNLLRTPIRRPRPSPEPSYLENIAVQELWDYTENNNANSNGGKLPSVVSRGINTDTPQPVENLSKKWRSQGSLVKPPVISHQLPKRANTVYIGNFNTSTQAWENMIISASVQKKDTGKDDRLPVVELKPFLSSTNKEWVPAKSRAWEDEDVENYQTLPQTSKSADYIYSTSSGFPDPQKLETPRQVEGVCSKAYPITGERKSVHPKNKDVAEGTIIQREVSFVPKFEREKTTTEEIKQQQSMLYNQFPPFSFISRELTEYDIQRQKDMRIHGQKMKKMPLHGNPIYMETWQMYKSSSNKNKTTKQELLDTLQSKMEVTENTYLDENIYDYFDRSVTLPSILVKPATQNSRQQSKNTRDRNNNRPGYRLGVVNSLDVMSMCGRPLTVEQNLTSHLKHSLEQLKRTKDSSFIISSNSNVYNRPERPSSNKIDVIGTPTIGEMTIREARKNNSPAGGSQSAPVKRSKIYNTASQSRSTTYFYDSGFDGSSNDRKSISCTSPSKSLQRTSRLQMHQIINQNVKNSKGESRDNLKIGQNVGGLHSSSGVQLDDPPSSPTGENHDGKQSQRTDDICSVDSGELDPRSGTKSVKSLRHLDSVKTVVFEDKVCDQKDNKEVDDENSEQKQMEDRIIGDSKTLTVDKIINGKDDKIIDDKQTEVQIVDDKATGDKMMDDKQIDDKIVGGKQAIDDKTIEDKQTNNQIMDDKQIDDKMNSINQPDDKTVDDKLTDDNMVGNKQENEDKISSEGKQEDTIVVNSEIANEAKSAEKDTGLDTEQPEKRQEESLNPEKPESKISPIPSNEPSERDNKDEGETPGVTNGMRIQPPVDEQQSVDTDVLS